MNKKDKEIKNNYQNKNYIDRKGYHLYKKIINSEELQKLKKKLTINSVSDEKNIISIKHFIDLEKYIIIPKKYGKDNFGKAEEKNLESDKINLVFNGSLKKEQNKPYDILKNHILNEKSGIFSLMTGKGKTVCAIKLICDLGLKTLIISASVNQIDILKQWERELKKFTKKINLGIIQGKNIDCENKDVILTTISSLVSKDCYKQLDGIGLVVIDECFPPWQKIITLEETIPIYYIYLSWKNKKDVFVKSYDTKNKKVCYKKVSYAWEKENETGLYRMILSNGEYVDCTPNHKFYMINYIWKTCEELVPGDCFLYLKNDIKAFVVLKNKFFYQTKIKVYDLEVEDVHNYFLDSGIIAHNCHHISSPKYSEALFKIGGSPYLLGLSATPERQDGLTKILKTWTGEPFYSDSETFKGLNAQILTISLNSDEYEEFYTYFFGEKRIAFTKMLSNLINIKKRNELLIDLLIMLSTEKRQILLLSDRIEHINLLCALLAKKIDKSLFSPYIGTKMKESEKKEAMTKKIILATSKSFSEGIDKKDLDTLILATPKKYIAENKKEDKYASVGFVQTIGRIFRKEHKDIHPLIIDLFDNFSVYKNQGYSRNRYYKQNLKNCQIKKLEINLEKYEKLEKDIFFFHKNIRSIEFFEQEEEENKKEKNEIQLLSDAE